MRRAACPLAGLLAFFAFTPLAPAADASAWSVARTSPAINYGGVSVAVEYMPGPLAGDQPGPPAISRAQAGFSHESPTKVSARLCWNGTSRCIPLASASVNTDAFNGLDAGKPMYLVYTASGKGPLPSPVYVRGNVIVWYGK